MKATVLLVRHGQTDSNTAGYYMGRSDEDLNQTGYAQARSLSARLANQTISAIYTSPVKRAFATATVIAGPHHIEPQTLDDITEVDLGEWHGLNMAQARERWPELWRQSRIDPSGVTFPGGESFTSVAERAVRGFRQVLSDNRNSTALLVTHDIIIRIVAAHVLGVPNSIYRRLEIGNASLSVVKTADQHTRMVSLNDTAHLGYWSDIVL